MSGWIKIHRKIENHWLYKNSKHLHWWIDILLSANYEKRKVLIKGKLIECNAGETVNSLETWAKRWGVDKTVTRRFLKLLENDSMIVLKNETVTTRITVCNYASYQIERNASETQTQRKSNAGETQVTPIKEEEKKEEEEKDIKFNFKKALIDLGIDKRLATEWLSVRKNKSLTNSKTAFEDFTDEVKKSGASPNDVLRLCIVKSWGGFKANWYKDEIAKQQQTSPQPLQQSQQTGLSLSSIPDIA
jgi:Uri superfamily endonuclease